MALRNAFEDLSVEDTQKAILYYLAAIHERLPRTDVADRVVVQAAESTQPISGTLAGVTTVTTVTGVTAVTNVNNFAGGNTALLPFQFSTGLLVPIYQNLVVS